MARERSTSNRDLTHRQFRSRLRTFRPADAAFVLHLAGCERCRRLVPRFAPLDETAQPIGDFLGSLAPLERDIVLDLTRGGYLFSLADQAFTSQDDLPPAELRSFLDSLRPEQMEAIRHLVDCESCRKAAAKSLAPKRTSSASLNSFPLQEATA
jgi:hypothetical protein